MKKLSLLLFISLIAFKSISQSVDLDREYINVSYVRLPSNPVLDENFRTYSVSVASSYISRSAYPSSVMEDKIIIEGFEKKNENGTIDIQIEIGDVIIKNVKITKREEVKKDKDGNVTSRKTFYKPVISYSTEGSYFLKDHADSPTYVLGGDLVHEGSEYNSYSAASKYYNDNKHSLKNQFTREFIKGIPGRINGKINYRYGYSQIKDKALLWILDSKKNPETEGHKKALADMQDIFSMMKYDQPIDDIKEKIKPIVAYFESVIPKFSEVKKKKHRKMRYASYFNIAYMYYYADIPDKAMEYANMLIENGYDKSNGKTLLRECNELKQRFEVNKLATRHFEVITTDNSTKGQYQGGDLADINPAEPVRVLEDRFVEAVLNNYDGKKVEGKIKIKAYNDADLSNVDMTNHFARSVRVMNLNDNDQVQGRNYFARENVSFTVNGVTYEAIKFKPVGNSSNGNVVSIDAAKFYFAKVIYKSDKLGLYRYKNELILKKADESKAQSTSTMAYAIGFKKKLAKLVGDCSDLAQLATEGTFSNDEESLLSFVQEYNENCK